MPPIRLATLMTCHNRCSVTLKCLECLHGQIFRECTVLDVFLVDDGCTDDTAHLVRTRFPKVTILNGNGSLFWCGGMRLAFSEAVKAGYDYYLWLNDDTVLFPNAVQTLLSTAEAMRGESGIEAIVVGTMQDPRTGCKTYGGVARPCRWRPLNFAPVASADRPRPCDTMHGNCVLIPRAVPDEIGIIGNFRHHLGDYDYGLRATKAGFGCFVAPGFAGECGWGPRPARHTDPHIPLRERIRFMCSPKGYPPKDWLCFVRAHTGWAWPYYFLKPWWPVLFPQLPLLRRTAGAALRRIRSSFSATG